MHALTVVFGNAAWRFLFRQKESVDKYRQFRADYPTQDLIIDDDFGQHAEIRAGAINGIQIEDMDLSKIAHVESALWQHHVQVTAQQRARNGPGITTSVPVLDPTTLRRQ